MIQAFRGWGYSYEVEYWPYKHKVLRSVLHMRKKQILVVLLSQCLISQSLLLLIYVFFPGQLALITSALVSRSLFIQLSECPDFLLISLLLLKSMVFPLQVTFLFGASKFKDFLQHFSTYSLSEIFLKLFVCKILINYST